METRPLTTDEQTRQHRARLVAGLHSPIGEIVRAIDRFERRPTRALLAALLGARDAYLESLEGDR